MKSTNPLKRKNNLTKKAKRIKLSISDYVTIKFNKKNNKKNNKNIINKKILDKKYNYNISSGDSSDSSDSDESEYLDESECLDESEYLDESHNSDDLDDLDDCSNSHNSNNSNNSDKSYYSNNNKILYFDSSDSSDSENEFDDTESNKFAINLLKKTYRHNIKLEPNKILDIYHKKIVKLDSKYKKNVKNNKYKLSIGKFKSNISSCKELDNNLRDSIDKLKKKFNLSDFIKDEESKINNVLLLTESNKNQYRIDKEFEEVYNQDNITLKNSLKYFKGLNFEKKKFYLDKLKNIKCLNSNYKIPNFIRILDCDTTNSNKEIILQKINSLENIDGSSEYYKLNNWINKIMNIPFGIYIKPPILKTDGSNKIKEYLKSVRKELDSNIYGHNVTKDQLIKILAHTITNPSEGGNVFALQGPPGVGKTALIQNGIAKALGRPYAFISLGGATDACFLEGHDYTYEGSNHGRIIELLQKTKCMNPVIYFDELDKVSETAKGEEIINILMHITDSIQNNHFNDKYFGSIDFDLSKAIMIFSFNDENRISHILKDRMKIIKVKGYKMIDKINIAKKFIIPKLITEIGLENVKIDFDDDILNFLIDTYTNEGGVRKLKELINDILLEINLRKLEDNIINGKKINSYVKINKNIIVNDIFKNKKKIEHIQINSQPRIGIVNGLWANDLGVGGLVPIECCWIPTQNKLQLELTGMQGKVMQESMSVARTIAWRILPDDIKNNINKKWEKNFDYGIHVHCPDGATPKDGPSAGGAITTCLISLLTDIQVDNKIAMTGEINLKGQITAIGGLEEKIFGAKKAGAILVLCPKENNHDLNEIKNKFPKLFNNNFNVKTIENIWEILDIVLLKKINWIRFD
jgi:endopeptidase La